MAEQGDLLLTTVYWLIGEQGEMQDCWRADSCYACDRVLGLWQTGLLEAGNLISIHPHRDQWAELELDFG